MSAFAPVEIGRTWQWQVSAPAAAPYDLTGWTVTLRCITHAGEELFKYTQADDELSITPVDLDGDTYNIQVRIDDSTTKDWPCISGKVEIVGYDPAGADFVLFPSTPMQTFRGAIA